MNRPICLMLTVALVLSLPLCGVRADDATRGAAPAPTVTSRTVLPHYLGAGEAAELAQLERTDALPGEVIGGQWSETDLTGWVITAVGVTALFLVLY